MFPLEAVSFGMNVVMSAFVKPDTFAGEFMKFVIAVARPLVPATVGYIGRVWRMSLTEK